MKESIFILYKQPSETLVSSSVAIIIYKRASVRKTSSRADNFFTCLTAW